MVLVTFRTIQSKIVKMEFTPETTIGEAKQRYADENCNGDVSNIKMIFKAKMLQNNVTIGSLNLGEKDFIVVHAPKPSAKPAQPPAQASTDSNQPAPPTPTAQAIDPQPLPLNTPSAPTAPTGGLPGFGGMPGAPAGGIPGMPGAMPGMPGAMPGAMPAQPAGGSEINTNSPEFQQGVTTLMELGFAQDDCVAALRAAYGNTDRAAEYLFSGNIPEPDEDRENDLNLIAQLRVIQASLLIQPRALENVVQMMEQADPNVRQHPEVILQRFGGLPQDKFDLEGIRNRTVQPLTQQEFEQVQLRAAQYVGMMAGGQPGGPAPGGPAPGGFPGGPAPGGFPGGPAPGGFPGGPAPGGFPGGPAPGGPAPGGPAPGGPAPGQRPVQGAEAMLASLPQEDQEAIRRLQQLGNFPLLEVIQIYQACDKNENQAANILFSNQE